MRHPPGVKKAGKKAIKKAGKKAVEQIKERRKDPGIKIHGKSIMTDDPRKPGRKMGYVEKKTTLPKYHKPKMKPAAVRKRSTQRKSY